MLTSDHVRSTIINPQIVRLELSLRLVLHVQDGARLCPGRDLSLDPPDPDFDPEDP